MRSIDATERAELEQLRLATRLSGVCTWSFELGTGSLVRARATFTAAQAAFGYDDAELPAELGAALELLVVSGDRARMLTELQAHLDGDTARYEAEVRVRHKDGSVHWTLARGVAVRDEAGHPIRVTGSSVDVTRMKHVEDEVRATKEAAEEQARKAVQQLRLAAELSGVHVWGYELGEDGDLATARPSFENDGILAGLGYGPGDFPHTPNARISAVVHPGDQARMYAGIQDCFAGTAPMLDAEFRLVARDGSVRWNLVRAIAMRDASGRPRTFMGTAVNITQLKQTQEELRRIKDRFELAISGSKACTWDFEIIDGDFANARVAFNNYWELLGYDGPPAGMDSLASVIDHVVAPEDRLSLATDLQSFLERQGQEWEREGRVVHRDGTVRWQLSRGVMSRDAAGTVTRFTGASIDITDRKLTEKALRESQERFRGTFENAAVGMILIDLEGRFLEYNARFCEFLGYSREELTGRRFTEFMVPGEAAQDLEQLRRVVRGEIQSFTRDKRYFSKEGDVVWGNITVSVIQRDTDGTAVHMMAILQDITERKALEVAIERAQARIHLAMRGSDVAVYEAEFPDGSLANTQWTFFNMWEPLGFDGASTPDTFEQLLPIAVHPDDQPEVVAQFEAAVQSRSPDWYIEHRVLHRDGSVRWRLSRGTLVFDEAGTITSFIGTEVDISKLKHIEGELLRARAAAEAANRAKDAFLANVSHEIRTPMNAILGMTELALDSSPSEHQRQLLSTVRSAAKNLLTIINDLLDFSKIESGKLTLDRADFSLRGVVGDTLRALVVRAQRKGLALLCRVARGVPDALEGDAGRLRQVLTNLVGNAIKFTPEGEVEVEVGAEPASGSSVMVIITVRDTGIGIAPDKQAAIFRAFEQGDASTTRKYGGTGLGLTISAQLASLMDGNITVESTPGRGSTFTFAARFARSAHAGSMVTPEPLADLRVLTVDDSELDRQTVAVPASAGPPPSRLEPSRSLRILVAEDNELNVALLQELLARRGHLARFARDGRAALELALQGEFELLLLDLHMPELDGFEVVQAIRDHERGTNRRLPIIALTARSSARDRERCLEAGMDEFLAKPIETAALWAVIERSLARRPLPARARGLEPGLLDARVILRACGWQASVLEKLRVVFRGTMPAQMSSVRAALAATDLQELRSAAHRLAGTVGTFSPVAAAVASTLEDAARRHDGESCVALAEQLGSLCDALLEATETLSIDALSS